MFTGETCPCIRFSLAKILVLVGGAIPPAPVLPASIRISAWLTSGVLGNTVQPLLSFAYEYIIIWVSVAWKPRETSLHTPYTLR